VFSNVVSKVGEGDSRLALECWNENAMMDDLIGEWSRFHFVGSILG
jgi:hypothetical protein